METLEEKLEKKYFDEFVIIDKLNQHPEGLNLGQWLNKYYPTRTKLMAVRSDKWSKLCPTCIYQNNKCKVMKCVDIRI